MVKKASELPFPQTLETERLSLRQWSQGDADTLFALASDPRVGPAAGWPAHTSVEDSARVIRDVLSVNGTYAVVLKDHGVIGSVGLQINEDLQAGELELGYWIGVPFWGHGYVGEASTALLDYAFNELAQDRVWCGAWEENTKSRRSQEKLGFVFDRVEQNWPVPLLGEIKTFVISTMTRKRWRQLRAQDHAAL